MRIALTRQISKLPTQLRRSLTWDQGKEMAEHVRFSIDSKIDVYFCDPHSPWQRGSNEKHQRSTPTVPAPHALFDDRLPYPDAADHTAFAVHRDGRLLSIEEPEQPPRRHIRVVLDWMEAAGLGP